MIVRLMNRVLNRSLGMTMFLFSFLDFFYPYIRRRVKNFGIIEGMTVVDYGCALGSYTTEIAKLVGERGNVYAVDVNRLAIEAVNRKLRKYKLGNVHPTLLPIWTDGYDTTLPSGLADLVCTIGIFSTIKRPTTFLGELRRIIKKDGTLIIDDNY